MSVRVALPWLVGSVVLLYAVDSLAQECGSATAITSSTSHSNCEDPSGALQWTLTVKCIDECGDVWHEELRNGSADGYCFKPLFFGSPTFCSPSWEYLNHVSGLTAKTSAWPQRWIQTFGCANQSVSSKTEVTCGCAPPCQEDPPPAPDPPPGPSPCSVQPPVETTVLDLVGATERGLETLGESIFTGRIEEADGFSYIMEDWALVGAGAQATGQVHFAGTGADSSAGHTDSRLQGAAPWAPEDRASIGLLVASPAHPHNGRHIPAPAVGLRLADKLPRSGEPVTFAVRIDVGEARSIRDVEVLFTAGRVPDWIDLEGEVRSRLQLRYASRRQHRVIVYAVVDLESGGGLQLRDSLVVLPLCCCESPGPAGCPPDY